MEVGVAGAEAKTPPMMSRLSRCYLWLLTGLGLATYFSAICIGVPNLPRVYLQAVKDAVDTGVANEVYLLIDGVEVDMTLIDPSSNDSTTLDEAGEMIQFTRTETNITVMYHTGMSVTITPLNVSTLFL